MSYGRRESLRPLFPHPPYLLHIFWERLSRAKLVDEKELSGVVGRDAGAECVQPGRLVPGSRRG